MSFLSRTERVLGKEGTALLAQKRVAVFGVGGVGSYVCEALARAGVGALDIFDGDAVAPSNLNRQLEALCSNVGMPKAAEMAKRIADINPACAVRAEQVMYTAENAQLYPFNRYDYVVDAVDMVSAKLEIIARANAAGVPVVSCMGTGNKLHPELFRLGLIEDTSVCPLARVMRRELKKRGIGKVRVVYSTEQPTVRDADARDGRAERVELKGKHPAPGSVSFVPGAAGLIIAGAVVRALAGVE